MKKSPPEFLTMTDIASMMGLSYPVTQRMYRDGELPVPADIPGRSILWPREVIELFIEKRVA